MNWTSFDNGIRYLINNLFLFLTINNWVRYKHETCDQPTKVGLNKKQTLNFILSYKNIQYFFKKKVHPKYFQKTLVDVWTFEAYEKASIPSSSTVEEFHIIEYLIL